ncbi:MAG: hypothetical protein R6U17_08085 [Thermoplasmata archaeon]
MENKSKLRIFRILSTLFTLAVIIMFVLAIYSSFLNPLINRSPFVELPSEDDIDWSFDEETLLVETVLTMENDGFYEMQDIQMDFDLFGFDRTLYSETVSVESLGIGEKRDEPMSFAINLNDFDDDEIEEFVFNRCDFKVSTRMTAKYPLSLMQLKMAYEETIQWDGVVLSLEFDHERAFVNSLPDQEGSVLTIPFEVETNDLLEGDANVFITMYDQSKDTVYSTEDISIPLGGYESHELSFELDEDSTEEFITNSQTVKFLSEITIDGLNMNFDHTTEHYWGAPLNDLSLVDLHVIGNEFTADIYFENDSPRYLNLEVEITVYDSADTPVGTYLQQFAVLQGEERDISVTIDVEGEPLYAKFRFYEQGTGMEYDMEEYIHDI